MASTGVRWAEGPYHEGRNLESVDLLFALFSTEICKTRSQVVGSARRVPPDGKRSSLALSASGLPFSFYSFFCTFSARSPRNSAGALARCLFLTSDTGKHTHARALDKRRKERCTNRTRRNELLARRVSSRHLFGRATRSPFSRRSLIPHWREICKT